MVIWWSNERGIADFNFDVPMPLCRNHAQALFKDVKESTDGALSFDVQIVPKKSCLGCKGQPIGATSSEGGAESERCGCHDLPVDECTDKDLDEEVLYIETAREKVISARLAPKKAPLKVESKEHPRSCSCWSCGRQRQADI